MEKVTTKMRAAASLYKTKSRGQHWFMLLYVSFHCHQLSEDVCSMQARSTFVYTFLKRDSKLAIHLMMKQGQDDNKENHRWHTKQKKRYLWSEFGCRVSITSNMLEVPIVSRVHLEGCIVQHSPLFWPEDQHPRLLKKIKMDGGETERRGMESDSQSSTTS